MATPSPIETKPLSRLSAVTAEEAKTTRRFQPKINHTPPLPAVNWAAVGQQAPQPLDAAPNRLPAAEVVVIAWTDAEWAALNHVFCSAGGTMTYASRTRGSWDGWQKFDKDAPSVGDWTFWGEYRLVQLGRAKALLFKSNTHLDYPGPQYLEKLILRLVSDVKPKLILSTGTAGGARLSDHIGTVNVVHSGALYQSKQPQSAWPVYKSAWRADWTLVANSGFRHLLFPVPTTESDLKAIGKEFNAFYKTDYPLATLNVDSLNMADPMPGINNLTATQTALLTTDSFVVGTSSGNLSNFACVEMDDAVIDKVCAAHKIEFGSVRNISDPAQNAVLPPAVQGHWGQAIYDCYGFYTSYNGAITAWAILSAQFKLK
jgi:nucleoside phosphorylase